LREKREKKNPSGGRKKNLAGQRGGRPEASPLVSWEKSSAIKEETLCG